MLRAVTRVEFLIDAGDPVAVTVPLEIVVPESDAGPIVISYGSNSHKPPKPALMVAEVFK